MRALLDENVPEPLIEPLEWLLHGHDIAHVGKRFKGIKDLQLYDKARRNRYDLIISADTSQLLDVDICKAIQRSGIHAVYFDTGVSNLDALAAASASLLLSMRPVLATLEKAEGQRVVVIDLIRGRPLHRVIDPRKEAPSAMWPRKQHGNHKPSRGPRRQS